MKATDHRIWDYQDKLGHGAPRSAESAWFSAGNPHDSRGMERAPCLQRRLRIFPGVVGGVQQYFVKSGYNLLL